MAWSEEVLVGKADVEENRHHIIDLETQVSAWPGWRSIEHIDQRDHSSLIRPIGMGSMSDLQHAYLFCCCRAA